MLAWVAGHGRVGEKGHSNAHPPEHVSHDCVAMTTLHEKIHDYRLSVTHNPLVATLWGGGVTETRGVLLHPCLRCAVFAHARCVGLPRLFYHLPHNKQDQAPNKTISDSNSYSRDSSSTSHRRIRGLQRQTAVHRGGRRLLPAEGRLRLDAQLLLCCSRSSSISPFQRDRMNTGSRHGVGQLRGYHKQQAR